jgi:hypothetical protein
VVGAFVVTRTLANIQVTETCSAVPLQCTYTFEEFFFSGGTYLVLQNSVFVCEGKLSANTLLLRHFAQFFHLPLQIMIRWTTTWIFGLDHAGTFVLEWI